MMNDLHTLLVETVTAGLLATAVGQARNAGITQMTAFFVGAHTEATIRRHPEVIALGRELLARLAEGEDIHLAVMLAAMNQNSGLHGEVLSVPFERFRDSVSVLLRIVEPRRDLYGTNLREYRRKAFERLEELHRRGTRLTYEDISTIVRGAELWGVVGNNDSCESTSPGYFRRLHERVGKQRARRRILHAWAHYMQIVIPRGANIRRSHLRSWITSNWEWLAPLPFKEACNAIFDRMMVEHRPFPNTPVQSH